MTELKRRLQRSKRNKTNTLVCDRKSQNKTAQVCLNDRKFDDRVVRTSWDATSIDTREIRKRIGLAKAVVSENKIQTIYMYQIAS